MLYVSYFACFLALFLNVEVMVYGYSVISDRKFKLSVLNIITVAISAVLLLLLYIFINAQYKLLIIYFINFIVLIIIFKENIFDTFLKTLLLFLFLTLVDFFLSFIIMSLSFIRNISPSYVLLLSAIETVVLCIIMFLIFKIKRITIILRNFMINVINRKHIISFFIILLLFVIFYIITYYHFVTASKTSLFVSLFVLISFLFLTVIMLIQYFKNEKGKIDQDALIKLISDYEAILENDRINRHEMLNNLVVLKSYPNKSSKKYDKILDNIISEYENKKSGTYHNICKLPSGIKGVVYYKMATINDKNIEVSTLISSDSYSMIEKIDSKLYYVVCKIVGILFDNAIEACVETNEKTILFDLYLEDDYIVIYIENSFSGDVDLLKITKKGYSSKGEKRGYGLYLVSKYVKLNDQLIFDQKIINNKFISILKIKNKKNE